MRCRRRAQFARTFFISRQLPRVTADIAKERPFLVLQAQVLGAKRVSRWTGKKRNSTSGAGANRLGARTGFVNLPKLTTVLVQRPGLF